MHFVFFSKRTAEIIRISKIENEYNGKKDTVPLSDIRNVEVER